MKNEEEELLIRDICARLPYGVRVKHGRTISVLSVNIMFDITADGTIPKPYLRPMSSMTEEEIEEYIRLQHKDCIDVERPAHCCKNSITAVVVTLTSRESVRYWYDDMVSSDTIDFLNKHHLDWRGLIPLELALEAPNNMYKI